MTDLTENKEIDFLKVRINLLDRKLDNTEPWSVQQRRLMQVRKELIDKLANLTARV